MQVILIEVTVKGNRDVSDFTRHAVARTRHLYDLQPNSVGQMRIIAHRGVALGSLASFDFTPAHSERERTVSLALCSMQYIIAEATCDDIVIDDIMRAAVERTFNKNLGMDFDAFKVAILRSYSIRKAL